MTNKKILVTGEALFIERHQFLFKAMSTHIKNLQFLPRSSEWYETKIPLITLKSFLTLRTGSASKANALFQKNKLAFILKSKRAEYEISKMTRPDIVFHIFGTYSPFWNKSDIPYVMYLDYTVALAERNWSEWAYFINHQQRVSWLQCEDLVYQRAKHIFCMSNVVKQSLIQDYDIDSQKITVVGSSGDFIENYNGEKIFGTKQILFNGSDFKRKGGDLVLNAFRKVRQAIPEAKLVIIGKKISVHEDGVENPGHISRSDIHTLFFNTDLVVAPAFCDPFPTFLMEAMNYGIPCIVSANDGMPEIVEHEVNGIVIEQPTADILANDGMPEIVEHQVNGIVIEQPTAELLANQIINLLSNPSMLTSMSQAARSQVRTKLNWKNVANNIVQVLSTIK